MDFCCYFVICLLIFISYKYNKYVFNIKLEHYWKYLKLSLFWIPSFLHLDICSPVELPPKTFVHPYNYYPGHSFAVCSYLKSMGESRGEGESRKHPETHSTHLYNWCGHLGQLTYTEKNSHIFWKITTKSQYATFLYVKAWFILENLDFKTLWS